MNIKAKIEEIITKVKSDKGFAERFASNPAQAVESVVGVQLPEEQVNSIIAGVKAKLSFDKADGLLGKAKKFF